MDPEVTAQEAQLEAEHWWYVGRRRLLAKLLARVRAPNDVRMLDVGSSTGTNLRMCRELNLGHCVGVDVSLYALEFARGKGLGPLEVGDICALPARSSAFDVVMATDVVEHIDDDAAAMRELSRVLAPGGSLFVTVPTFELLWSRHDELSHHRRRYRRPELAALVEGAGLELERCCYFNFFLFVPILVVRKVMGWLRIKHKGDTSLSFGPINRVLLWIFERDIDLALRVRFPFGVSLLAVAKKPVISAASGFRSEPAEQVRA